MSFIHGDCIKHNERLLYLLNVCRRAPSLARTKPLHALFITLCPSIHQPIFIRNNLVSLYASLGQLSVAAKVFGEMPERNAVSFNTMISAYSKSGNVEKAWDVFSEMRARGFLPTQFTVAGLLSCASLDVSAGFQLHGLSIKNGLFCADAYVGTALLGLYGMLEQLEMTLKVFKDMPSKSLVTWNSMMSLLGQRGFVEDSLCLFRELVRFQAFLSEFSLLGVLSGLSSEEHLEIGQQLHCFAVKKGLDCKVSICNSLISTYSKCGNMDAAEKIFEGADFRDTVSWNSIIVGTAKSESPLKALKLFATMSEHGLSPSQATFVSAVNACTHMEAWRFGGPIHAMVIKSGFEMDVFVGSALVDFYAKCGNLENSLLCFDDIWEKNVVSWNSLILAHGNKDSPFCVSLFLQMLQAGLRPNEFTFSAVLKSSRVADLQQLHSMIIKLGYEDNDYVLSSLMTSYAKNGLMNGALVLLDGSNASFSVVPSNIVAGIYNRSGQYLESVKLLSMLEQPDAVSWNIVIAACSRAGNDNEVLELFKHMLQSNIYPDNYTYVSILSVCTKLCNLMLGSSIHGLMTKMDFSRCDTFVCNVLIDMYGKCGSIRSAVKIFEETRNKNLITWTALISSLGIHGYVLEAFEKFKEMVLQGFKPDRVSFISMLTVCRHGGLVKEGMELFQKMRLDFEVEPEMDHYRCIVDLLVRNGHLKEAEQLIAEMPFPPDTLIWRSFLEGCKRFTQLQGINM